MNPHVIRENLCPHKGEKVLIKVHGMRNKTEKYIGILKDIYPQIFTVECQGSLKCFSYSELINKDIELYFI